MVNTIKNLLSPQEINQLLAYHNIDDERTDHRPNDVRSKHPRWDLDSWPQDIVERCLRHALDTEYDIEEVLFLESITKFGLHVDTADGNSNIYKTIIIPLLIDGRGHTVFFDNYWYGASSKFHKDTEQTNKHINGPLGGDIYRSEFLADCTKTVNFDPTLKFDPEIHREYLNQMDIQDLHGLTLSEIVEWRPGDVIVFDRAQLHSASSQHRRKIGITVFTQKKHAQS